MPAAVARGILSGIDTALGGNDYRVPVGVEFMTESLAEHPFGSSESVRLGGVEEADPEIDRVPDRRLGLVGVDGTPLPAQLPSAEGDPRDLQFRPAQSNRLHASTLSGAGLCSPAGLASH